MMKAKIKNINFLTVAKEKYFGLSQEWFKNSLQIKAGCGATVAATIELYYLQTKNLKNLEIDDALIVMESFWPYLLPTNRGLNSTELFYKGIEKYYSDKAQKIKYNYLNVDFQNKVPFIEIKNFIINSLENDRPVAFLNLCNGCEKNLDRWHWVTVVELFDEEDTTFINILDDKEIKKINLKLWYDTIKNDGGFVEFYYID